MSIDVNNHFLEVLEVERLELDHFWEIHRQQLEQRDQDGSMARSRVSRMTKRFMTSEILKSKVRNLKQFEDFKCLACMYNMQIASFHCIFDIFVL